MTASSSTATSRSPGCSAPRTKTCWAGRSALSWRPKSVSLFEALWQRSRSETESGRSPPCRGHGAQVPVYLALRLLPADGPAQTSMVIADLTEQKRYQEIMASEVFATSVLDQAQDAIVVCDPSGRVIRANRAAERLCGVNPLLQPFDVVFPLRRVIEPSPGDPRRPTQNCRSFPWHPRCNSSVESKRLSSARTAYGSSCC